MEYQIMVDGIEIQSNEQVNEKEARAYITRISAIYARIIQRRRYHPLS